MSDDVNGLGPVEIEWIINRQQIASDLEATEQMFDEAVSKVEERSSEAGAAITKKLQEQLAAVQQARAQFTALDPKIVGLEEYETGLAALTQNEKRLQDAIAGRVASQQVQTRVTKESNQVIEAAKQEVISLGNSGKESFEQVATSAGKSTNYFRAAWSGLRQIAFALPGVGVAGIIAFATGPIIDYITALIKGKDALNLFLQTAKAANEVQANADKDAAVQIATLKVLYTTATDVKKSMDERTEAAQRLRETYPEEFANASNLAIINGKVKSSYDDVTASVLQYAKSKAALAKISDLEAKNLDAQFAIDKNNSAKAQEIAKAYAAYQQQLKNQSPESAAASARGDEVYKTAGGFFSTPLGQLKQVIKQINEQTNIANLPFAQTLQMNNKVEDYLTSFVKTVDKGSEGLAKANKLLGNNLENLNSLIEKSGSFADLENIKSALETKLKALAPDDAQIATYQQQIRKIEELEKQYQPKLTDGNADAQSLKNKLALLRELDAATQSYNAKQLSEDQAALTAISNKFDQLRQKIAAFNREPRNKNNQISQSDISGLAPAEFSALGNQADLNENKYIAQDLQVKRQLYAEYEAYREKVGSDIANAEYADLLKSGQTFEAYIQTLQKSLTDAQNEVSPAAFEERKKMYEKYAQEIQKINSSFYLGMLADTLSFEQQTNLIIENAIKKATALMNAGKKDQADLILAQADDEVSLRVDSQKQTVQQYKKFYDQVAGLTKEEAINQIKFAQDRADADLHARKINEDTYNSLVRYIYQANQAINSNTVLNGLNAIGEALINIGKSAEGLDAGFSSTLNTIGEAITKVAALGKSIEAAKVSIANFSQNKKDAGGGFLGTVSALAGSIPIIGGLISSVVGVVSSVVGAFKAAKESAIAAAKEMKSYQESLIAGEVKYNELLREQAAAIKDINALNAQQLDQRRQLLAQQQTEAQADYNRLLSLIQNNGQQVTGEHTEKYGGFLGIARKTKVVQDLAAIGGADYDTLFKLYSEGKLSDETAKWFEQLKSVHDEMGDIGDATKQVNDQIDQIFTGTTADSLEQAILTGLKNGKRGFADFAGDFSQTIQDSIASIFEDTYLKDKAAAYYKEFASFAESGGGLDDQELAKLKSDYADLVNGASTTYDNLSKITGNTNNSATGTKTQGISGAIAGITETQANALEGITRGIQQAVNEIVDSHAVGKQTLADQLDEVRKQTIIQMKIEVNTRRTADNTDKMVDSLSSIDSNTSTKGLTNTLRAAGVVK